MNGFDLKLLNDFQRRLPLVSRPFEVVARRCASSEAAVIARLRELHRAGAVSRVGAVFAPNRIGASTLFALAVPPQRLESVAQVLDGFAEVNHSYEREHALNLWAVATASDAQSLDGVLADIHGRTGLPVLNLPLLEEFRIDLGFDLTGAAEMPRQATLNGPRQELSAAERTLVHALQCGLPLVEAPFHELGSRTGMSEQAVLAVLARWLASGVIRRFGVIVRHHELGYCANAMAVWDVPDDVVSVLGARLAAAPGVTLAYRRRRSPPQWHYNLFCMVHGKERAAVRRMLEDLGRELGLDAYPGEVLFSTRRFKQTGARYVAEGAAVSHG